MKKKDARSANAPGARYSEAKARGVKLGTNNLTPEGGLKGVAIGVAVNAARKAEAYETIVPIVCQLRAEGLSLREIAERDRDASPARIAAFGDRRRLHSGAGRDRML